MLEFLSANAGNIVVILLLAVIVALISIKLIKDKRAGKACSGCGGGCAGCPHGCKK